MMPQATNLQDALRASGKCGEASPSGDGYCTRAPHPAGQAHTNVSGAWNTFRAPSDEQPTCMVCGNGMYHAHGTTYSGADRAEVSLWVATDPANPDLGRHETFPVHTYCLRNIVGYRHEDAEAFDQQRTR